jgi:hypothetical protein
VPPAPRRLAAGPCTGAVVVWLLALLLAACSSGPESTDDGGAAASTSSSASRAPADDQLVVELDRGEGGEPERYTVTCGETVAGDLPDVAAACAHLEGLDDPFVPVRNDATCTQEYGGPQAARVTGRWAGEPVDLQLSRTDGCRISQWDRLGPLLPGPVA